MKTLSLIGLAILAAALVGCGPGVDNPNTPESNGTAPSAVVPNKKAEAGKGGLAPTDLTPAPPGMKTGIPH
jgi:hypothetical protein